MKSMKKAVSLMLALVLCFAMTITASAAETGTITITGVTEGTTYEVYKLLDLESYNTGSGAYAYKVNTNWTAFFALPETLAHFNIDADGYVTWSGSEEAAVVAAFAQSALAYAEANGITPVKSSANTGEFAVTGNVGVFSDLELGYYLVDSTAGALCGLTTTNPNASVNAKNAVPIIDKQVQEDLSGLWGSTNTADIGQIVNYMSIIHVTSGAEDYVLHDKMSDGLTFVHDTANSRGVTAVKQISGSTGAETTLVEGVDYTVVLSGFDDECTFEIIFTEAGMAKFAPNDRIAVYYNAMLNREAVAGSVGNANESWLEYGEEHYTTHDKTQTFTFSIDIVKTDSQNTLLDGAAFRIYDAAVGGNEIAVVPLMEADDITPVRDGSGNPMYRRARADETGVDIVVKGGKVTVIGFDNGYYYLEETVAPDGYNKLTTRQPFTITDSNMDAIFNAGIYSTGSGVHVVNKTGSMLPETGGMGTVMFISCGMMTVLAASVLLVTKKRMSMIQD